MGGTSSTLAKVAAVEDFGGLDIIVPNAGMLGIGSVTDLLVETWHQTLDTNLSAVFYLIKMIPRGSQAARLSSTAGGFSVDRLRVETDPVGEMAYGEQSQDS